MKIDLEYIASRYHHFNQLCFAGKLSMPKMALSRARKTLGQVRFRRKARFFGGYTYSDFVFLISAVGATSLSSEELDDVILHEMIHYSILSEQQQDSSAHGRLFRAEMRRINTLFGRHISISYRGLMMGTFPQGCRSIVAVVYMQNGTCGVMVVARTRLLLMWDLLLRASEVLSVQWYLSDSPFFCSLPRRMSPKCHVMDRQFLEEHLRSAMPLQREGNRIFVQK